MKRIFVALGLIFALACALRVFAVPQAAPAGQQASKATVKKKASAQEGERKFQENCGRCHNPPEALSPREVKAVLQHMRVRAMLSQEDEQLILKYLAP